MRAAFIGYGAVSSVFMANAWSSNVEFELITRTGKAVELHVALPQHTCSFKPATHPMSKAGLFDLLIVCIKSYQVNDFIEQVRPFITKPTTFMFINNGMGIKELVETQLSDCSIVIGTTSVASLKTANARVKQTGDGKTDLGWVNIGPSQSHQANLNQFVIHPVWHDDINYPLWLKLAANAVINPITAFTNQKNGAILLKENQYIATLLCQEIALVMNTQGYAVTATELLDFVNKIAANTKDNYSSMNRDICYKRKTEIEFINGYVCQIAKRNGLCVTNNRDWYQRIKSLERLNAV